MYNKIKVISLYQPFASLLAYGIKKNETRPGPTSHTFEKGKYLIHAAKKWNDELERLCLKEPFYSALKQMSYNLGYFAKNILPLSSVDFDIKLINNEIIFPFGCIVGEFEIKECGTVVGFDTPHENNIIDINNIASQIIIELKDNEELLIDKNSVEFEFGDYSLGRSIWIGQNHRVLKRPIPYKGGQGYYQNFKGNYEEIEFLEDDIDKAIQENDIIELREKLNDIVNELE